VEGFVVRELSEIASNWRAKETLDDYLKHENIGGIEHIDTRALVRHIRDKGAMRACISSVDLDENSLLEKSRRAPEMLNRELASSVSTKAIYEVGAKSAERFHVVCFDFGVKTNSLREFAARGCRVTVVPAAASADEILKMKPDGIFLSNGPGDPASMKAVIGELTKLSRSKIPMFGICLGHQLLASAFGGETYKLHFGHRGGNHPIKNLRTGKIAIASHNHGFAVDAKSLPPDLEVSHVNINDDTIAGIRHKTLPIFSVQYHPEAAPGPHDAVQHFDEFIELMELAKSKAANS
jgi:carbamoyl-phosphate synthase small subunit